MVAPGVAGGIRGRFYGQQEKVLVLKCALWTCKSNQAQRTEVAQLPNINISLYIDLSSANRRNTMTEQTSSSSINNT